MPHLNFTDQNFQNEVLESKILVLVDFWAPWCGPCQMLGPIIEKIAAEYEGKSVKIGKLNVDDNPQTAEKYQVMSIPTIILFKNGEIKEKLMGLQSEEALKNVIDKYL